MNSIAKKLLSSVIVLFVSLCANADASFTVDGIKYGSYDGKTAYVTFGNEYYSGSIIIPSNVVYNNITYNVTSIRELRGYSITSIEIPNSVTSIGDWAFYASKITSIEIPSSVKSIGNYAFRNCINLTSIKIPNGVTTIGSNVFEECKSLTSIEISNGVISIGDAAFYGCSNLTALTIPNSVTSIGTSAFCDCSNLISIEIPSNVISIGSNAFSGCTGLSSIVISNGVSSIGDYAFFGCPITSIEIPSSVTSMGSEAFGACSMLNSIKSMATTPPSLGSVDTFNGVDKSIPVYVPQNSVDAYKAADGWKYFTNIQSLEPQPVEMFFTVDGIRYVTHDGVTASVTSLENEEKYSGHIVVPSDVTYNGINYRVTAIDGAAFGWCENMTSIYLPNSITQIGEAAFRHCTSLTTIKIPNSVETIGKLVFGYCTSLESIVCEAETPPEINFVGWIPDTSIPLYVPINSIDAYKAADGWNEFTNIQGLEPQPVEIFFTVDGIRYGSSDGKTAYVTSGCIDQGSVIIPSKVTDSGIAYSVTSIGTSAFTHCTSFTSIEIPSSVSSIGNETFYYCSNLTTIKIPNSVATIGNHAFYNCSNLASIEIPNSVTSIDVATFGGCTSLTSIKIPNSVTSIGGAAFVGCTNLSSVEIPNSVSLIGWRAFENCSMLTSIKCMATTPPSIESVDTFNGVDKNIPVYVPLNSIEAYKSADGWKEFTNIQGIYNQWDSFYAYYSDGLYEAYTTVNLDSISKVKPDGQFESVSQYENMYAYYSNGTVISITTTGLDSISVIKPKNTGTVVDCQGNIYPTVQIGSQTWMAENLRCTKYDTQSERAGEILPTSNSEVDTPYYVDGKDNSLWKHSDYAGNLTEGHIQKFGLLYNWAATVGVDDGSQSVSFTGNRQGICPNGWHVPTADECQNLISYIGITDGKGTDVVGKHLKSRSGWYSDPSSVGSGSDSYGFCALPSGSTGVNGNQMMVYFVGFGSYYWTSSQSQITSSYAQECSVEFYRDDVRCDVNGTSTESAKSVRCVKN